MDLDSKSKKGSQKFILLYIVVVLFSFIIGFVLTYEVEGFDVLPILARSLAIILFPSAVTFIILGISTLFKKTLSFELFTYTLFAIWIIGASTDLITYYFI